MFKAGFQYNIRCFLRMAILKIKIKLRKCYNTYMKALWGEMTAVASQCICPLHIPASYERADVLTHPVVLS